MKVISATNLLRVIVDRGMLVPRLLMVVVAVIYGFVSGGNLVAKVSV